MDGILPLWKPKGMTSHDCVMKVRKLLHTKKVGHTGTLDPEVEGVLPICIGQATKIVPFLTDTKKTYIAEICLGSATDTEDSYGKVIAEKPVIPLSDEQINSAIQSFHGTITQVPPMYSAVKVKGKKLYEYARENIEVERPKRLVTIHQIERLEQAEPSINRIRFKAVCSKGTYIRTLCVDIGKKLGYPAHMSYLVRIKTGSFSEENTVNFDDIVLAKEKGQIGNLLMPISCGVDHLPTLKVDEITQQKVRYGQKIKWPVEELPSTPFKVVFGEGELLAIYKIDPEQPNQIRAVRVFN
ncbi:tRNA pseudouridine(55) synthase TruB [Virgibacillus soli]|uniref:tRNA pseudouridine(55) synthase TruB n=1 Tax=Paracerasibacillus soli TaxID=480284 RepID=UPI0035E55080